MTTEQTLSAKETEMCLKEFMSQKDQNEYYATNK